MRLAIYGYGNLGRGVEAAATAASDVSLVGIFTRRDVRKVRAASGAEVFAAEEVFAFCDRVDVLAVCGGSATDLPTMTPQLASRFQVVDSFDTHATIPAHFAAVDAAAREGGHTALIAAGWDPGLLSLARLYFAAALPCGKSYAFWGRGASEGHSDAVRHIPGVKDARAYTLPREEVRQAVAAEQTVLLPAGAFHRRVCYVVAEAGADTCRIEREIRALPHYFAGNDTEVHFISEAEMAREHAALPHGGHVYRNGTTGGRGEVKNALSLSLRTDSNPSLTGSLLLSFARAVVRLHERGEYGCKTVFDLPPAALLPMAPAALREAFL